ncbi:hypothetical protein [Amycolatopsis sp. NPDC051071]|uniref:hypothetical protein n=1 Tax=Amycolatopsis sp. NPDC051071 TaxID=3154637 RepID=UPI00342AD3A3
MIDMSTWKELVVDVVDELELDPYNVRLELSDGVTESDIIQDLFSNEGVLTLVDGIAKVGYLTHEIPIVVRRKKKLVVVEGNRRVAALKSIQNPYIAPHFQSQVTRIASNIPNRGSLKKISVKLAPSEDEALQLVGAIHTGSQRRAWSPNRQAAFFKAQLVGGKSPKDLIEQYPTVDVKKFVLRSGFLDVFASADFDDLELKNYVASRKFTVSTLERLYPNNDFLRIMGLVVDQDYRVTTSLPRQVFGKLAEKVVRDIKTKYTDTRKLNKADSEFYKAYLEELRVLLDEADAASLEDSSLDDRPGTAGGDPGTRQTPSGGFKGHEPKDDTPKVKPENKPADDGAQPAEVKAKQRVRKPVHLNTAELTVPASYPPSIGLILGEVARINIEFYPNATMDLLRTFLEKSIKAYAEELGVNLRPHGSNGFVYLSHCFAWLEGHLRAKGNRGLAQVVKKLASDKIGGYYNVSLDALNAVNHNFKFHAIPDDVRNCWHSIYELMKVILAP